MIGPASISVHALGVIMKAMPNEGLTNSLVITSLIGSKRSFRVLSYIYTTNYGTSFFCVHKHWCAQTCMVHYVISREAVKQRSVARRKSIGQPLLGWQRAWEDCRVTSLGCRHPRTPRE